jgi:hypothetical protein
MSANASFTPDYRQGSPKPIGFYIASNDQDLLSHVSRIVNRCGCIGLMDTAGRVQYLVDGRKGSPFAARRIEDTASGILSEKNQQSEKLFDCVCESVDQVLAEYSLGSNLKGYRYIRHMLQLSAMDPSLLRPVSKTLYPEVAAYFKVSLSQIERDLRYMIKNSRNGSFSNLSNTAALCFLHDLISIRVRKLQKQYDS